MSTDRPTDHPAEQATERPAEQATGRARILDAAVGRFAAHGYAGVSLKVIAADAGVSPALVVHHFGSKEGLARACDDLVLGAIRDGLRQALAEGGQMDVLAAFRRRHQAHADALPYLARALSEGGPGIDELVDELAEETVRAMELAVDNGTYRPTERPRERALVLLTWSLGAVVLHGHLQRLLGADITGEPEALLPYLRGATDILAGGLFTPAFEHGVREAVARLEQERAP